MTSRMHSVLKRVSAYSTLAALGLAGAAMVASCPLRVGPATEGAAPGFSGSSVTVNRASKAFASSRIHLAANYGKLPLSFEPNRGQAPEGVKFLSHGRGYSLFLSGTEAVLALQKASVVRRASSAAKTKTAEIASGRTTDNPAPAAGMFVTLRLLNANARASVQGDAELPGKVNYFLGKDPKKWRTDVATYAAVHYRNVYPGVDLLYHGSQDGHLEYDFVVAPGADPSAIGMDVAAVSDRRTAVGTPPLQIAADGDLIIPTVDGEVRFHEPTVFQPAESDADSEIRNAKFEAHRSANRQATIVHRKSVDGHFTLRAGNQVGFAVGPYDRTRPLVIDPVLNYATYLGGSSANLGSGIAVDSSGDAYVVGSTFSVDFPTMNPIYPNHGNDGGLRDAFVTELDPGGDALIYSTYLGGSGDDEGYGIALDSTGAAYVVGTTSSSDFPTTGGVFQGSQPGITNVFVAKLAPGGSALSYSTYLGGNNIDYGRGIAVDSGDNAYVTGYSYSSNFPTANAFQSTLNGTSNAFVTKLNTGATGLVYSTYLGGNYLDFGQAIALDSSGDAYVTGYTSSGNFPTLNAYQSGLPGTTNPFVTKLNPAGNALVYSTYLGSYEFDYGYGIAVNAAGNAYVTGATDSYYFPTAGNPYQGYFAGGLADAFVAELNTAGNGLVYSTYLGGSGEDQGYGIALDPAGDAFVTGATFSPDFPTPNGFQTTHGNDYGESDAFVAMLNGAGSGLTYSTFLGGNNYDYGYGIALDATGNAYVVGQTASSDFPVTGSAFQNSNANGTQEAFVAQIQAVTLAAGINLNPTVLAFGPQPMGVVSGVQTSTLSNGGTGPLTVTSMVISGDYAFATTPTSCPYTGGTVLSGGSCTIDVTFDPTATGARNGTVTLTDNGAGSPQIVTLTGTGTPAAPVAGVAPSSLGFADQEANTTSASQPVTLSNTGSAALTITSITASANFGQTNACGASLAVGGNCTINVTFNPTASGALNGTLTVTDNSNGAAGSTQTVSLSGSGTAPVAGISPSSLTFATQNIGTTSASQPVTLSNTGTAPLTIAGITAGANFGQTNTCGNSLAAGNSCTINVTFTPTANGALSGTLTVTDDSNGVVGSTQTVSLGGTGGGAPIANVAPTTTLSLGTTVINVASTGQAATLSNTGNAVLTVASIVVSSGYAQTNNCGASVAAGGSCTINITFTPTAPGPLNGVLTVTDNSNGVAGSTQALNLSGTGADFSVASTSGTQSVGQGGKALYTINVGSVGGTFSSAVTLACSNLPAGTTCAFATSPVTPGASGASTQLTLTTTAPTAARVLPPFAGHHPPTGLPGLLLTAVLALLAGVGLMGRRSPRWAAGSCLLFCALLGATFMAGCGAGGFPLPQVGGTSAGTYTITVTGTSGSLQHSTTVTLTVTGS